MTGLVFVVAGLVVLNVAFAILVVVLRVFNERRASRLEQQQQAWHPRLIGLIFHDSDPEELRKRVKLADQRAVVEIASNVARRLRGSDRERIQQFAGPLLGSTISDLGARRAETRARALQIVSCLGEDEHEITIVACLDDPSPLVSLVAARALCQPSRARWFIEVLDRLHRYAEWSQALMASMLADVGLDAAPAMRAYLHDEDRPTHARAAVARSLQILRDAESADAAAAQIPSADSELAAACLRLLAVVGRATHADDVRPLLIDDRSFVRAAAITAFNIFIIGYFAVLNGTYLLLSLTAFHELRRYVERLESLEINDLLASSGGLPISLLVPAFNEAATIVPSVRSLLTLTYADYEIVVVNDGSSDDTLAVLIAAFGLDPVVRVPTRSLSSETVVGIYQSDRHENLIVLDKENGGKADALNAGLNYSRSALFCAMDADTTLESEALARVVRPFLEDASMVAVGGIVRIANGCSINGGSFDGVRLARNMLVRFQVLEYLRSFLAARVGWNALGATLIISGAFGAFRRSGVVDAGGFDPTTGGEDMELIVRLHRHCRDRGIAYRIEFIPDPVAWTEAPEGLSELGRQRDRWQRGLVQVVFRHRRMVPNPKYGIPGTVALPYYVLFDVLGPLIEALGYVAFAVAVFSGKASGFYIAAFLIATVFLGSALSVSAIALEELSFRRYRRFGDLVTLLGVALVENFGYRQLSTWWRLRGLVSASRRDLRWGAMERRGFDSSYPRPGTTAGTPEPATDTAIPPRVASG